MYAFFFFIILKHEACKHGNPHILSLTLRDSKAINLQDKDGLTPLHWVRNKIIIIFKKLNNHLKK